MQGTFQGLVALPQPVAESHPENNNNTNNRGRNSGGVLCFFTDKSE